tara:strand:- start:17 stop:223 length:207 start_codon:yes stop_codon:yes gene_type:complete
MNDEITLEPGDIVEPVVWPETSESIGRYGIVHSWYHSEATGMRLKIYWIKQRRVGEFGMPPKAVKKVS